MILGYVLFEITDLGSPQSAKVFCGRPWLSSGSKLSGSYRINDVLAWCPENRCDIESYGSLHVIIPLDDAADFAFRMRWQ